MQNFYFYTFYFFLFLGLGPAQPTWARLGPASPARPLAQTSGPAGLSSTRVAALCKWIKIHLHSVKDTWNNSEEEVSYLVYWRRRRAVADQPAIFLLSLPLSLFLCFFVSFGDTPFCRFTPSLFSSSPLVSPVYVFFVSLCCSSSSFFLFLSICAPVFFFCPSVPRFCFSIFFSGSRPRFRSFLPSFLSQFFFVWFVLPCEFAFAQLL